ncbi:hypothetical protein PVAP13_3NG179422 [Panicum virgatum]|uniref:Uncharacterized protein n=1 Tax=Panicum virgatum TaxID=38727 RepID=A0A8T0U5G1_PANVG|nr:hypothetical protein PVAP13_3NG179422 [Panicum virgatum]
MASFSSHAQALCCHRAAMAGKSCAGTTARAVHGFLPESEEDAEDEARVRSARRLLPLGYAAAPILSAADLAMERVLEVEEGRRRRSAGVRRVRGRHASDWEEMKRIMSGANLSIPLTCKINRKEKEKKSPNRP